MIVRPPCTQGALDLTLCELELSDWTHRAFRGGIKIVVYSSDRACRAARLLSCILIRAWVTVCDYRIREKRGDRNDVLARVADRNVLADSVRR